MSVTVIFRGRVWEGANAQHALRTHNAVTILLVYDMLLIYR